MSVPFTFSMEAIYLIKKIWVDPLENRVALGYDPYTYRHTREEAEAFCKTGRKYTHKDCWQIQDNYHLDEFIFEEIPYK